MADEIFLRDGNRVAVLGLEKDDGSGDVMMARCDANGKLKATATVSASGAPTDAQYVVLAVNGTLTAERVLTGTANQITITDNGAGSTVVLSLPQNIHTAATPSFASLTLTAASSLTLGTASTNTGAIILKNSTNANNTVIQAGAAGAALTFTLPTTDGNASEFLQTDGNGVLSWAAGGTGDVTAGAALTDNAIVRGDGGAKGVQTSSVLISDTNDVTGMTTLTLPNTGLHLLDTNASHDLIIAPGSDLTADRTLTVTTGDADRTITLAGALTTAADFITSGANSLTLTTTGATNVTLPTSGTLYGTATGSITSAQLAGSLTDETGTGVAVFATSPTLVTPVLGVATATSINKVTITAPATSATLTIADGKTLTVNHSLTLAGTDATTMTFPSTSATIARTDAGQTFTGVQVMTSPDITTSLTTGSTTFSLVNATATTVNFAGAATTMAIGAAGGNATFNCNIQLAENSSIKLDPAGSADGKYTGITISGTAGATLAFGDLIYLDPTDSRWELADANAASGADGDSRGILGMCVLAAAADGNATTILLNGVIRADAAFPAMTINAPFYVSETAGDITSTAPTTTDAVVRTVGYAITTDEMFFNPASYFQTAV